MPVLSCVYEKYTIFSLFQSIQERYFVILCVLCEIMEKYRQSAIILYDVYKKQFLFHNEGEPSFIRRLYG